MPPPKSLLECNEIPDRETHKHKQKSSQGQNLEKQKTGRRVPSHPAQPRKWNPRSRVGLLAALLQTTLSQRNLQSLQLYCKAPPTFKMTHSNFQLLMKWQLITSGNVVMTLWTKISVYWVFSFIFLCIYLSLVVAIKKKNGTDWVE